MSLTQGDSPRRIEWTGERCVPWADDIQVVYEHYQRYLFVASLARGRRVLDLGSGEGYGTAILAQQAESVVGLDIDKDSVMHANERYRAENLQFQQGDMLDLSRFDNGIFDLVVCFEAIEHIENHEQLLVEVIRILDDDGVFVGSTPDRLIYNEVSGKTNPFHVHELSRDEFEELLRSRFKHLRLWGQTVSVGSLLFPTDFGKGDGSVISLVRDQDGWMRGTKFDPTYYIVVASDGALPDLPAYSTLIDTDRELVNVAVRGRDRSLLDLHAAIEEKAVTEHREMLALGSLQESQERALSLESQARVLRLRFESARDEAERNFVELERVRNVLVQVELSSSAIKTELDGLLRSRQFRLGRLLYSKIEHIFPIGGLRRRGAAKAIRLVRRLRRYTLLTHQTAPADDVPVADVSAEYRDFGQLPSIASSANPKVSIIIPVHGEWETTLKCLWSLVASKPTVAYEVIVVDDASPDRTLVALNQINGLQVLHLENNQGFLRAVNAGAAIGSGEYLVLLNNDTEVQPGWLDALVDTAELENDIGLVGAKLVYPNGFLQEAGGIIFNDASGWNYGRHMEAGDPAFTFARDVDYCSGACVLVRRALWEQLGGFDHRFAPAYYEDADLAFSIRKLGYRVVYQPKAVVIHDEGGSYGTDDSPRKTLLMETNRKVFQEKWAAELEQQFERKELNVRVASWRGHSGRVLVMDHQTPMIDQDAGSLRMFELLRILREMNFAITFIPHNKWNEPRYTEALEEMGIEVLHGHIDTPYVIQQLSPHLGLAILSRPKVAWGVLPTLREHSPATKIIYDTVDLHFLRERRRAELENNPEASRMAEHYRELELWLTNAADATVVVSEVEQTLLSQEAPSATIHIVPTIHRIQHPGKDFGEREGLLFVGSFNHPPNRDAVEWLTRDILPIVRRSLANVPTFIVGSNPTEEVKALTGADVKILGWVPDLRSLYAQTRLVVAPLRYGAGIKGKIGEAASFGVPVVTTHIGAEGLHFIEDEDILLSDTAEGFAEAIVRAYRDPILWSKLAMNSRRSIALQCSPAIIKDQLVQIMNDLKI